MFVTFSLNPLIAYQHDARPISVRVCLLCPKHATPWAVGLADAPRWWRMRACLAAEAEPTVKAKTERRKEREGKRQERKSQCPQIHHPRSRSAMTQPPSAPCNQFRFSYDSDHAARAALLGGCAGGWDQPRASSMRCFCSGSMAPSSQPSTPTSSQPDTARASAGGGERMMRREERVGFGGRRGEGGQEGRGREGRRERERRER
eukprot:2800453-Rhodomonas_salina.2